MEKGNFQERDRKRRDKNSGERKKACDNCRVKYTFYESTVFLINENLCFLENGFP